MIDLAPGYGQMASREAILVRLDASPDLTAATTLPRGPERKQAVWNALMATAERSQQPFNAIADALRGAGHVTDVQHLVSPNMLVITPKFGHAKTVFEAFQIAGVDSIWANADGSLMWSPETGVQEPPLPGRDNEYDADVPTLTNEGPPGDTPPTPWGIAAVGAPAAWEQGITGAGLVFGSIDTGVDSIHPALYDRYRGRIGVGTYDDDYAWMDLERDHEAPHDPHGHGTHTTGTAVGGLGIGVAPGAQWIATNVLNKTADSFLKAIQWMQAPTRRDGSAPDPAKAPDVVGMSWSMGVAGQDLFGDSFQHLVAAGIVPVKSAGNNGPEPSTITAPGHLEDAIVVGNVDEQLRPSDSSSRGPARRWDGSTVRKPDLAAPGSGIESSIPGGRYTPSSGTSMSQPHVAGAVLLLLERYPQLTHAQLKDALTSSARDLETPGWDAATGAGLLDIPAAVQRAAELVGGEQGATRIEQAA